MTLETTHRATNELGPGVLNNKLIWTSASGITAADPHSFGGCLRRWWYEQVGGFKQPSTKAQSKGTDLHAEIEGYELRGEQLTSALAMAGAHFIQAPGPGIYVERPLAHRMGDGRLAWWLQAGNIPLAGHIDVQNLRGEYIDENGTLVKDEPLTLETKDWKTTSSFDYAKTAVELGENVQLITYAQAGFKMEPSFELARLTHVYFLTKGRPQAKLVTIRVPRRHVEARWEYAESVVRTMDDAAAETNPDKVTPNLKACDAYRGCPQRERCNAYKHNSLDNLYAKVSQDMGLLQNNPQIMQQPAQQTQPQVDMRAQLAAEEQQLRTQQQQYAPSANILDAWRRIEAHGRGTPALGQGAAQAYAAARGQALGQHAGYAGAGQLGGVTLMDPAHIFQFANDLDAQGAPPAPAPQPTAYTPPPMPNSGNTTPTMGILPPGAPESRPELAQVRPAASEIDPTVKYDATPDVPPEPKKRGRPAKAKDDSSTAPATEAPPSAPPAAAAASPAPPASASQGVPSGAVLTSTTGNSSGVYVDCIPNTPFRSLHSYVDGLNTELSRRYCVDDAGKPTVQDIRCAPKNSILGFGGWKGAVRDIVLSNPPLIDVYVLDTRGSEIAEVVADALRDLCTRTGVTYVRSTR